MLAIEGGKSPEAIVSQAHGWPAVIGLAAMRLDINRLDAALPAEELYDYFAEDLFANSPLELRHALFLLALGGDASVEITHELLGPQHDGYMADAARTWVHGTRRVQFSDDPSAAPRVSAYEAPRATSDDIDASVGELSRSLLAACTGTSV